MDAESSKVAGAGWSVASHPCLHVVAATHLVAAGPRQPSPVLGPEMGPV